MCRVGLSGPNWPRNPVRLSHSHLLPSAGNQRDGMAGRLYRVAHLFGAIPSPGQAGAFAQPKRWHKGLLIFSVLVSCSSLAHLLLISCSSHLFGAMSSSRRAQAGAARAELRGGGRLGHQGADGAHRPSVRQHIHSRAHSTTQPCTRPFESFPRHRQPLWLPTF